MRTYCTREIQKPKTAAMTMELSYLQLKTANDARLTEEVQNEQRRRNLLVLVRHYLEEYGFLDTVQVLEKEAGHTLKKYEVCDNIDLMTVLQEYESYYYVKFKKQPKLVKKLGGSAEHRRTTPKNKQQLQKQFSSPFSLPMISALTKDSTDGGDFCIQSGNVEGGVGVRHKKIRKTENGTLSSPVISDGLGIEGTSVTTGLPPKGTQRKGSVKREDETSNDKQSEQPKDAEDSQDRLLKPLAGYAGYNNELKDLAAVISRDIYLENPNVKWDDIIGLDDAKRLIKEAVVYPIKYPQLFKGILSPWKGLLLYGPPGTGKTMLAKAVATECKTTFFNISASSIVSKWRGDSEKLVRVLFELARFHAPSTIFMDELESIMGQRSGYGASGGSEHEGSRRMKTELLVQMDGLARSNDLVFLLAASNLPWDLDYAMLRRLEKRILVHLPTESARCAMLRHYLPPVIAKDPVQITSTVDYENVAKLTDGYSGSDIQLVCKEAAMRPLRKVFDRLESISKNTCDLEFIQVDPVTTQDVEISISRTKPSAQGLVTKYTLWQEQYESS